MIPLACPHCDNPLDILGEYYFRPMPFESLTDNEQFERMEASNIGDYDCPHCNKPFSTSIQNVEIDAIVTIKITKQVTEADKKYLKWKEGQKNETT